MEEKCDWCGKIIKDIEVDGEYICDRYDVPLVCICNRCIEKQEAEFWVDEYRLQYYENDRLGWVS